jgi:hypothetical protein
MREKDERDALGEKRIPRASGVRLTEYEPGRSDGYVRRLDREATSFFFTNFPEEALADDLWKMFARFGRVGEVYIPQKLNKWGCRFGFVKYMEVKDVGELERCLGDIWMGTFKLRVNISRFAKGSTSNQQKQPGEHVRLELKAKQVQQGLSFKTVLENNVPVQKSKENVSAKAMGESTREGRGLGVEAEPEKL